MLLELKNVTKVFSGKREIVADKDINLQVPEGELIAILGPTGCGKTTLLRMIVGLDKPSSGQVIYKQKSLTGLNTEATIVFQNSALFPWLTVQENVEVALKAKGIPCSLKSSRAIELLDMVGLDGFENAYPKELSGGMKQKVSFARAMAVEPDLLCLDEPFSALDVLSAASLLGEFLELWQSKVLSAKTVIFVTHDIEEAVFIADRIIIMDKNPGRIIAELKVRISQPRSHKGKDFVALVDRVYEVMTGKLSPEEIEKLSVIEKAILKKFIPDVNVNDIVGLVERLNESPSDQADIYKLAEELKIGSDEMLKFVEAAQLLEFVAIVKGDIILTALGETFAEASILARKEMFAARIRRIPVFHWLLNMLFEGEQIKKELVLENLELYFSDQEAEKQMDVIIRWGRYAEMFAYDDDTEVIYREPGIS